MSMFSLFVEDSDYIHNHEWTFVYLSYFLIFSLISKLCPCQSYLCLSRIPKLSKPESIFLFLHFPCLTIASLLLTVCPCQCSLCLSRLLTTFTTMSGNISIHLIGQFFSLISKLYPVQCFLCLSRIPTVFETRVYFDNSFSLIDSLSLSMFSLFV